MSRVAIGFRVKSGRAIAVVLTGSADAPQPLMRIEVALSDPDVAETRQPYHDGFFRQQEDSKEIARRIRIVERCAKASVASLLETIDARGPAASSRLSATLVVGSLIDPATVGNPHIRAHAAEGRLFRTVLADSLAAHGVRASVFVEKDLAAKAAAVRRSRAQLTRAVDRFGAALGKPWRADEKAASIAAWIGLAQRR